MPAQATNKTNLASIESAVATYKANAALASGDAKHVRFAKFLEREITRFKGTVQGLA